MNSFSKMIALGMCLGAALATDSGTGKGRPQKNMFKLRLSMLDGIRKNRRALNPPAKRTSTGPTEADLARAENNKEWEYCGGVGEQLFLRLQRRFGLVMKGSPQHSINLKGATKSDARSDNSVEEAHFWDDEGVDSERLEKDAKPGQVIILQIEICGIHVFTIEKRCIEGEQKWSLHQGYVGNYSGFWWEGLTKKTVQPNIAGSFGHIGRGLDRDARMNEVGTILRECREEWGKGNAVPEVSRKEFLKSFKKFMTNGHKLRDICEDDKMEMQAREWKTLPFLPESQLKYADTVRVMIQEVEFRSDQRDVCEYMENHTDGSNPFLLHALVQEAYHEIHAPESSSSGSSTDGSPRSQSPTADPTGAALPGAMDAGDES